MFLNKEKEDLIKQFILKAIYDDDMPLPKSLKINKLYNSIYYKYGNRGCRDLKFIIKKSDDGKLIVDFYLKTDDYASHKRIDELGNVTELENYEGQFGWPIFESLEETEREHERIRKHNQYVLELLKKKGFEK